MRRIRLIRKLAECMDGVDVSGHRAGDLLDLPDSQADVLIAEGWAEPHEPPRPPTAVVSRQRHRHPPKAELIADAADRSPRTLQTIERLRQVREEMDKQRLERNERRRAEDNIREELQDSRSKTIKKE